MQLERRSSRRKSVHLFCNQYIDGMPVLGETLELSMSGALVRRVLGPDVDRACYALEIGLPELPHERVFLCAAPIWRSNNFEAVRFVAQTQGDKLRLADLLRSLNRLN